MRQEEDSPSLEDDLNDLGSGVNSPLKNLIDAEPEREPDYSRMEGNITHSVLENEKAVHGLRKI